MSKEIETKLMYAVITKYKKGQTIQLFKTKKQAEEYFNLRNNISELGKRIKKQK